MRELDKRLMAIGLGIGSRPRHVQRLSRKLVFVLGILVGFALARVMTLIAH